MQRDEPLALRPRTWRLKLETSAAWIMAGVFWLDDRQWTAIEPLLPKHQRRAKYLTQAAIDAKRQGLDDIGFRREMLLQVVPEEGQDVLLEDIHYYDEPPFDDGNHLAHGVDLAISTKESADYTAIVTGEIAWEQERLSIYIQPHPVIRRM